MAKKALILDLDNTIYGVPTIGDALFRPLFALIEKSGAHKAEVDAIKSDLMRRPYQTVARQYGFSPELTRQGLELLSGTPYTGPIAAFEDYRHTRDLPCTRFLVTTGFTTLQWSKIRGMGIEEDFKEIHIVDPLITKQTKKDVFADILQRHRYAPPEVLVVGDDPESELKAALELGIEAVLYDKYGRYPEGNMVPRIEDFGELGVLVAG